MISFGSPGWLLLIIPVALFAVVHRDRPWVWVRAAACLALGIAIADPMVSRDGGRTNVFVLVDNSPSLGDDGLRMAMEHVAAIRDEGGSRVRVASAFPIPQLVTADPVALVGDWSGRLALVEAVDSSGLTIDSAGPSRLVILTDGLDGDPDRTVDAVERSAARGVPVDVIGITVDRDPELEIADFRVPERLEPGRPFDLPVGVRSTAPQRVETRVFHNDLLVYESMDSVAEGETRLTLENLVPEAGVGAWRVEVRGSIDTRPENNVLTRFGFAAGTTRVVLVDPDPSAVEALASILESAGLTADIRRPGGLPSTAEDWTGIDAVVLSNTPADALSAVQLGALTTWVEEGGGLLVAGGPNAFAAGAYAETALADLLPVSPDYSDRADLPVTALYVSLDRSGSMGAPAGGSTKMALTNAGAVRAMELLDRRDLFGLAAVDTVVHPVLPLGRISDREAARRLIESITAGGGGIYVFSAMVAAFRELAVADARVKHLILFSDAADAEEKEAPEGSGIAATALDLAAAMLAERITVSVVALGADSDQDTEFLRALAEAGGGRFYLTSDATTLPRIFAEETLRATRDSLVETPFYAGVGASHPAADAIDWDSAPELLGYNAARARAGVPPVLVTADATPLYAEWQRGLGRVGALLTDVQARWTRDWISWPGFGQWITQTVRGLAAMPLEIRPEIVVREYGNSLTAEITLRDETGRPVMGAAPQVAVPGDRSARSVRAQPVAPGRYTAEMVIPSDMDSGLLSVTLGDSVTHVPWNRPATSEAWVLRETGAFLDRLVEAGNGMLNPEVEQIFRAVEGAPSRTVRLFPWLLAAAILLWPLDIWIRRRRSRSARVL